MSQQTDDLRSAAIDNALSRHMLRRINSTQVQCDCGQTFPLSANPHLLSGEMMWHLRDVILDAAEMPEPDAIEALIDVMAEAYYDHLDPAVMRTREDREAFESMLRALLDGGYVVLTDQLERDAVRTWAGDLREMDDAPRDVNGDLCSPDEYLFRVLSSESPKEPR